MSTRLMFVIAHGKAEDIRGLTMESRARIVTINQWLRSYRGLFTTSKILTSPVREAIQSSEMIGKVFGSPVISKDILMEKDGCCPSLQEISELVARNQDVDALILVVDPKTASIFPIYYGAILGRGDFPEIEFKPGEGCCILMDSKTYQFLS